MPLRELADEILRLSEHRASTPVLVTPSYLSFRQRFFLELVRTLANKTDRSIRIDWYRRMPGYFSFIGDSLASLRVSRDNRALARLMSQHCGNVGPSVGSAAKIQIAATIARPGGAERDLVVGLCDHRLELPPWTTPIRLGSKPK